MRVKELRLTGFKSFADPSGVVVRPGLTGIVGPNGCGKSNIVEAILWGMGEAAPSSVRSDEMDDVIFSGGGGRPPRNFAEVTISIEPGGIPVPGEPDGVKDVDVTRRVTRQSGSVYRINGRDARARDIQTMFGDAGTGARSCAIVRQDRIGELINAKPANRRRILEDAAGVAGLHQRRHEVQLRINATLRNLEIVEQSLSQLNRQLASLKRESARAGRYRGIAARLRRTEILHAYARWRQETEEELRLENQLAQATTHTAHAASAASRAAQTRMQAAERVSPLRQAQVEAAAAFARISGEADDLDRRIQEAKARIASTEAQIEQHLADLKRERDLGEDAQTNLVVLDEAEANEPEGDEVVLQSALEAAEADERARVRDLNEAEGKLDTENTRLAKIAAEQAEREKQERDSGFTLKQLFSEEAELAARIADAERSHGEAVECAKRAEPVVAESRSRLEAATETAEKSESERNAAESAERDARTHHAEATRIVATLNAERIALNELLAGSEPGTSPPIAASVRADEGYETALGAALGDDLHLPEVERSDAASGWVARTTPPDPQLLPEGAAPLSENVQAPPSLGPRLAQVGLVDAEDGDRLQVTLRPGQRLVSLAGDLWRWDGLRLARGRAGENAARKLQARNRLQYLESEFPAAEVKAAEADRLRVQAENRLAEATGSRDEAQVAVRTCLEAISEGTARASQCQSATELAAAQLASLKETHQRLSAARVETQSRISNLRENTDQEADLETLQGSVSKARNRLEETRADALNARGETGRLRRILETIEETRRTRAAERNAWSLRLKKARKRETELEERLQGLRDSLSKERGQPGVLEERKANLSEAVESARRARDAAEEQLAGAERAFREAGEKERAAETALADARESQARIEAHSEGAAERVGEATAHLRKIAECDPAEVPGQLNIEPETMSAAGEYELEIQALRAERERLGPVNLRAEAEMREVSEAHDALNADKADLDGALGKFEEAVERLNTDGRARLLEAFHKVDQHFREVFTTLFGAQANASLKLIDAEDPFDSGLEIYAQPPGKRLVSLAQMSGGEKALTAIALIFALFLASPSPLCVLDEVDAPLDDANIQRFCDLLEEMTRRTRARFLVVTHHAITISRMDQLYGVTMAEQGVSQLVSVDYGSAIERLAA